MSWQLLLSHSFNRLKLWPCKHTDKHCHGAYTKLLFSIKNSSSIRAVKHSSQKKIINPRYHATPPL
jgi:hypothetical protein